MNLLTPPDGPRDAIVSVSQHSSVKKEINIQSVDIDGLYSTNSLPASIEILNDSYLCWSGSSLGSCQ